MCVRHNRHISRYRDIYRTIFKFAAMWALMASLVRGFRSFMPRNWWTSARCLLSWSLFMARFLGLLLLSIVVPSLLRACSFFNLLSLVLLSFLPACVLPSTLYFMFTLPPSFIVTSPGYTFQPHPNARLWHACFFWLLLPSGLMYPSSSSLCPPLCV